MQLLTLLALTATTTTAFSRPPQGLRPPTRIHAGGGDARQVVILFGPPGSGKGTQVRRRTLPRARAPRGRATRACTCCDRLRS